MIMYFLEVSLCCITTIFARHESIPLMSNKYVVKTQIVHNEKKNYRISSYSFRGNYSFFDLEIQRSQYISSKVTVHKCAETIQGRKLYEEIR